MKIDGLQDGVELVRFGAPLKGEFYLQSERVRLCDNGERMHGSYYPVIRPAHGYQFEFDAPYDFWRVLKTFDNPKSVTVTFLLQHSGQQDLLNHLLALIPHE